MRIVVDLQGAQTESRFRGIGRYCIALTQALLRNRGGHEVIITANGMFPETIESIRATFDGLISQDDIRVWQAVGPLSWLDPANAWRRDAADLLREEFLAALQADVVHIGNFFDGVADNMTCSIGKRANIPTTVTFYDAIPLIQSEVYLKPYPIVESFYHARVKELSKAALVFAISESARREAIDYANVPAERVISISSACDPIFSPAVVPDSAKAALWHKLGLSGNGFVLYSGGVDPRKNHLRLIEAFARLPRPLREAHPLVLIGSALADQRLKFLDHAQAHGLSAREFVQGGHVTDSELVDLYRLCTLFVFPSMHEGFGLPVLEAMSCGAPTICANTTSLPEVMGRADSMFDPLDVQGLATLMEALLTDSRRRDELIRYGLERSKFFSWDRCAQTVLAAFEDLHRREPKPTVAQQPLLEQLARVVGAAAGQQHKPADQHLVALAAAVTSNNSWSKLTAVGTRQLLVDVSIIAESDGQSGVQRVVHGVLSSLIQSSPTGFRIEPVYSPADAASFRYARRFVRRRYPQMPLSGDEDDIISLNPGDVFLGLDLHHSAIHRPEFFGHLRQMGVRTVFLVYDLLPIHLPHCFRPGMSELHTSWLRLICQTDGVVCESQDVADGLITWLNAHAIQRKRPLAIGWSHNGCSVPDERTNPRGDDLDENALAQIRGRITFLYVATLEPRKGHRQLLAAFDLLWAHGFEVNLVLVGRVGWAVDDLVGRIRQHPQIGRHLQWLEGIDDALLERVYRDSDCLVVPSLGEGFGLPLIEAGVRELPILARDLPVFREVAGSHASYFRGESAQELADAVEHWLELYQQGAVPASAGIKPLSWAESTENLLKLVVGSQWPVHWQRQPTLFLDVSVIVRLDAKSGVQRVVRALARNLLLTPLAGISVCLIWFDDDQNFRHALRLQTYLHHRVDSQADEPLVDFRAGDLYLALDLNLGLQTLMEPLQRRLRDRGVAIWFLAYDLCPLRRPEWWESAVSDGFAQWIASAARVASGFVCISETTAADVRLYLSQEGSPGTGIPVRSFHIGADIDDSEPTRGLPPDAEQVLMRLRRRPTFLMVGTIEPRKGHAQALAAFEELWSQGHEINLAIVGKKGWLVDDLFERLSRHPRRGHEIHLLESISDEYLSEVYAASSCLLAASEGEGFGLPLVEAAMNHLSIIARDLPVFHEVAGDHAYYFSGLASSELAVAILAWLDLFALGRHPKTEGMPWLTWRQSARQLVHALGLVDAGDPARTAM